MEFRKVRREFEHRVRNSLLRLVTLWLKKDTVRLPSNGADFSNIIVLRTSHNVGDVIRVSGLLDECRRLFPRAHLTLLVHVRLAELFENHPGVDELWQIDPRWYLQPLALVRLVRNLRRRQFDAAFDCANPEAPSLNNWLLTRLANARYRVGFQFPDAQTFLNVLVERQPAAHFISNQLRLLSPFGQPASFRLPRVVLTEAEIKAARDFLGDRWCEESAKGRRVMMFIPRPNDRTWPLPVYLELGELLCRDGTLLLISFGPGDKRCHDPNVQAFVSDWPGQIRVLPETRLRQVAAVMSQCDLFITNDCGPMHLAVAVGTPTVAVFLHDTKGVAGYEDGQKYFVVTGADDRERLGQTHNLARKILNQKRSAH
jgi:ADP-heptose:LPS heptosyltransferase